MNSDTLIIIPAFNEERSITGVITAINRLYPLVDIAVVNDGSDDRTARFAKEAGAIVLSHPFNMGYGVALQTGYKYAVRNLYKYIVQMDGDGQHAPESIEKLLSIVKSGHADIALGSRFLENSQYRTSVCRLIGIKLFRFILNKLSRQNIKDVTTGFQAMNRRVMNIFIHDIFPCDYPDADVLLLLSMLGIRVNEVPVIMYPNQYGKSMHHNPLGTIYYIFKMIMSMFLTKIRKYPSFDREEWR